ncbi:hypothetical protein B0H34DRAFT_705163 [Crassisporium funariophilum]|nr:hypothetical protein B0H34DRAFT_705163 [Crassisporium funariophilum]
MPPPQPGIFAVPYGATHTQGGMTSSTSGGAGGKTARMGHGGYPQDASVNGDMGVAYHHGGIQQHMHPSQSHMHQSNPHSQHQHQQGGGVAGPSSRHAVVSMEDGRKDKKRKDVSGKLGKEMSDRRDDSGRHFTESISALHTTAHILATRPEINPMFKLRLFPLTLERSALLAQLEVEERYAIECAQIAYDEERERVEEEWKRGRQRVRERLMEGIEERRRRAREEKEGEGTIGDASLDSHSRPPITRKLRNKLGTSPPPTPHSGPASAHPNTGFINIFNTPNTNTSHLPFTTGPFLNPHSLSVDELPSPFPLPLTSTNIPNGGTTNGGPAGAAGPANGRRRAKGAQGQGQLIGGLGKSLLLLNTTKDTELENDLGEIRRGNKRRRATAAANGAKSGA